MYKKLIVLLLIFCYFTTPVSAAATDVKNDANLAVGLVSYWEQEQSAGATSVDSHATTSNDLADNNTVGSASGIQGNAADYDGSADFHSDADPSALEPSGDISISAWFNADTFSSSQNSIVTKTTDGSGSTRQYYFMMDSQSGSPVQTRLVFDVRSPGGGGSSQGYSSDSTTFATGTWTHVVGTYDTATGRITLYVNGVKDCDSVTADCEINASNGGNMNGGTGDFRVGRRSTVVNAYFDGKIDEIGFWNKELSATEVSDLYNSGSGIPYNAPPAAAPADTPTFLLISWIIPALFRVKYII